MYTDLIEAAITTVIAASIRIVRARDCSHLPYCRFAIPFVLRARIYSDHAAAHPIAVRLATGEKRDRSGSGETVWSGCAAMHVTSKR